MESLSKTPLSLAQAGQIVARQFGSQRAIASLAELTEGYYNAAYHLRLTDGWECVLKIAPPPNLRVLQYEQDILRTEVEVLRLVKHQTEIPVPAIFFHDESGSLLPSPYYAMEFIPGMPLHKLREKLTSEQQAHLDQSLGRYLRQMNALQYDKFGYYAQPKFQSSSWSAAFTGMLTSVLEDGAAVGIVLPIPADEILALVRCHTAALDEVTTPSLVHWDLWDGNVFVDPNTLEITGLIDFERALWADPLMEVNFGAFGVNPQFLAGYGQIQPFTPAETIRRTLYNIYLFLIMVIEPTYRHYPTPDQENWARLRLAEELAQLP